MGGLFRGWVGGWVSVGGRGSIGRHPTPEHYLCPPANRAHQATATTTTTTSATTTIIIISGAISCSKCIAIEPQTATPEEGEASGSASRKGRQQSKRRATLRELGGGGRRAVQRDRLNRGSLALMDSSRPPHRRPSSSSHAAATAASVLK